MFLFVSQEKRESHKKIKIKTNADREEAESSLFGIITLFHFVTPVLEPYLHLIGRQLQSFRDEIAFVRCDIFLFFKKLLQLVHLPLRKKDPSLFGSWQLLISNRLGAN